mmetsp:Transcript_55919/g.137039  ORF Transcript_55919/g.137039 Transcript_55919/m.137039 type:complete len:309 (-) Transcript_55919:1271-2197(-)
MPDTPFEAACKNIVAGTCGGVSIVAVGHPFDTVKVRLQCQNALLHPGQAPLYTGPLDCVRKTLAQEGVIGLYRGAASPLVGQMLFRATLFLSNGECKRLVGGGKPPHDMTLRQITVAGTLTGGVVSFVESPIDMFKSKMQVLRFQEEVAKARGESFKGFRSSAECVRHIVREHGLRGVYQGFQGTMIRNLVSNSFFFPSFEFIKRALTPKGEKASSGALLAAGSLSGIAYWLVPYPLDVVKSSLMSDNIDPSKRQYKGWWDCAQKVYTKGGLRRFYLGISPCILRAAPANTALFFTFETVSGWLGADN